MKYIFVLFVLISCSNNNNLHLSNVELLDDIMKEHDDLMLEMKNIKNIKTNLLEIDGIEEDNEAIKNLDIARMSMMNFMKDFSNEFSFDKYPMDKKTHDNLEGIDLLQVNNKLNEFKKSIDDVSEKFETSMSSGQKILDGIE
ncbi:MAG: hypothetical protein VX968_04195 [Bacteroidota bacterium]|jgi:hypothetical protein|nr:hypothetical protein [Bacteroidota bacterium]|tara:strand:- start:6594 stop:7019 length:426 start_codon:yes stop_codon:yes gene_type:complete